MTENHQTEGGRLLAGPTPEVDARRRAATSTFLRRMHTLALQYGRITQEEHDLLMARLDAAA